MKGALMRSISEEVNQMNNCEKLKELVDGLPQGSLTEARLLNLLRTLEQSCPELFLPPPPSDGKPEN